ncbi:MAG TPA: OmpH family outer membrane protein [Allosphingosinicella sp.]|jgi:Skp family chaperone for outer membrane proteins|nr:OmpH family outer membrane protein [Allosphingosinicella sp.]
MNKLAFGAALAALSLALPGVAQAQRTPGAVIVVVDTDRIYRECTACKAAQTQLQGMVASARTRATQLGQPLQTEAQSIEQAAGALRNQTGAARTAAETALNTRMQQFQQRQTTAQQEVQRLEQNIQSTQANVLRQINAKLNPVITQVMNARNANIALDVSATLARSNTLDVTADVLTALNAALPSVSVTPLPQAQQPAQPQPQGR